MPASVQGCTSLPEVRIYTLKDFMHDVWDEAFCGVKVCQLYKLFNDNSLLRPYIDGGWLYV